MSTTMAKKETVQRKWYVLDAAGKPLGRTAVVAAKLLRGKHKPDFTPNVDCGDFVIIINCEKAVLTGKKAGAEVLPSLHWLDRQPEGDQVPPADGRASRICNGAGRQGYAAEEHHRQSCYDSSEAV